MHPCTNLAIGLILIQEGQVIVYEFKKLNLAELNYPTPEKELLVTHALKVWNPYLLKDLLPLK
jgi:hypothetical protein